MTQMQLQHLFFGKSFEVGAWYEFDRNLAIKNHGPDVIVHLALLSPSSLVHLDFSLHGEAFKTWLTAKNRESFIVSAESVGLRWGREFTGCRSSVMISKPRTDLDTAQISFAD